MWASYRRSDPSRLRWIVLVAASIVIATGCSILLAPERGSGDIDGQVPTDADLDVDVDVDGDGDGDIDGDTDTDGDVDSDVDTDGDGDGDEDGDADGDADPDIEGECDDERPCDDGVDCTDDHCMDGTCRFFPDPDECAEDAECDPEMGCVWRIWVDRACDGDCGEGTEREPFTSIEEGLRAVRDDVINLVQVAAGEYREAGEFNYNKTDARLIVIGVPGVEWRSDSSNTVLKVTAGAEVEIRQISMRGKQRALEVDDATVTLRQVTLGGNSKEGIKAKGTSVVWMLRSLIKENEEVGVLIDETADVHAVNSFFVRNGAGSTVGGAFLMEAAGTKLGLVNCTIADNLPTKLPGAVLNPRGALVVTTNLVVWHNSVFESVTCEGCPLGGDSYFLEPDVPFVLGDGDRVEVEDYKLQLGSKAIDRGGPGRGSRQPTTGVS